MRNIIITIIFILLILTAIASAYTQEAWYEAAESSCTGYRVDSTKSKEIEEVKFDEEILRKIDLISPNSSFEMPKVRPAASGVAGPPQSGA